MHEQPPFPAHDAYDRPAPNTTPHIPVSFDLQVTRYRYPLYLNNDAPRPHVSAVPSTPDAVVRWFDRYQQLGAQPSAEHIIQIAKAGDRQLDILRQLGVAVPHYRHFIGKDPEGQGSVLYSLVERIHGQTMTRNVMQYVPDQSRQLVNSWCDYLLRAWRTDEPFLYDIYKIGQYSLTDDNQQIVLHDIEPRLAKPRDADGTPSESFTLAVSFVMGEELLHKDRITELENCHPDLA